MRFLPLLSTFALSAAQSQFQLTDSPPSIASFSVGNFTTLTHSSHPNHKISLKKHDPAEAFCNGSTKGYSGYLSVGEWKHFFFYYFDSRKSPDTDPLIMWLNGGPGCSSMAGLFMEFGPCLVNDHGNGTYPNPSSWIEEASVFFLDQPVGAGFSFADEGRGAEVNGTLAASEDVHAFLQIWYSTFPAARALPFHIGGESYGGHYIPIFAKHILEENAKVAEAEQIPLTSIIIGDGIFDNLHQRPSFWDISCTNATGIGPLLNATVCKEMSTHVLECEHLWASAYASKDILIGKLAYEFCENKLAGPFLASGINPYDISKMCDGELCYPRFSIVSTYLNRDDVRAALGVPVGLKQKYQSCNGEIWERFHAGGDFTYQSFEELVYLLNEGVKALIYVGTYDWACNFVGLERAFAALEWEGMTGYRYAAEFERREWEGGLWWEEQGLRFVRVERAGHIVPLDKPVEALIMVRAWLRGEGM